jgi:hypothetical protein
MATFRKVVPSRKKLESKKLESKKLQGIRKKRGTNFGQFTAKLTQHRQGAREIMRSRRPSLHEFAILSPFFR